LNELLPQGLSMIAAPSKMGKSWMCLQLCAAVANGDTFLDRKTNRAACWYLALEDGQYRMQDRLAKQLNGGNAPGNLHISHKAPTMDGKQLLDLFAEKLETTPNLKLIIVDTYQKVRTVRPKNADSYMSDYADLSPLKEFADDNKIAILLIHHLRKMTDEGDPFNMILGSVGIPGALDTIMVLTKKNRNDDEAKLFTTGRDISQQELVIRMGKDTSFKWECVGTVEEMRQKQERQKYEDNPIVRVVKHILAKQSEWRGTVSDFIKESCEIFNEMRVEPNAARLGRQIAEVEAELYFRDGIDHKLTRSGDARIHHFYPKKAKLAQIAQPKMEFDP